MAKEKIKIEKSKKRIPVPIKPPKAEPPQKAYNRKKERSISKEINRKDNIE
jgi:hypothetical protein